MKIYLVGRRLSLQVSSTSPFLAAIIVDFQFGPLPIGATEEDLRNAALRPTKDVHHVRHRLLDFNVRLVDATMMIVIFVYCCLIYYLRTNFVLCLSIHYYLLLTNDYYHYHYHFSYFTVGMFHHDGNLVGWFSTSCFSINSVWLTLLGFAEPSISSIYFQHF